MANSFLSPQEILPTAQEKFEGKLIFGFSYFVLFYHENVCCVYSLEPHHLGDSNEYIPLFY